MLLAMIKKISVWIYLNISTVPYINIAVQEIGIGRNLQYSYINAEKRDFCGCLCLIVVLERYKTALNAKN
jgi:hypothetical protein